MKVRYKPDVISSISDFCHQKESNTYIYLIIVAAGILKYYL